MTAVQSDPTPGLSIDEVQQTDPDHHTDQSGHPQTAIGLTGDRQQRAPKARWTQKGPDALRDQEQRQCNEEFVHRTEIPRLWRDEADGRFRLAACPWFVQSWAVFQSRPRLSNPKTFVTACLRHTTAANDAVSCT